jgi:hypothetical protein
MTLHDLGHITPKRTIRPKSNCPTPYKVAYRDVAAAGMALAKLVFRDEPGHTEKRTYLCPCGAWHLSSKPAWKPKKEAAHVH